MCISLIQSFQDRNAFLDCGGLIRDISVFPDGDRLLVTALTTNSNDPTHTNEVVIFTLTAALLEEEEKNYNSLRKDFCRKFTSLCISGETTKKNIKV